ncbi:hypothetical protein A1OS_15490 [Enterovibrio norvegicus]|uniref:tetratricopeptide repeat protein n=1 Tax=Enterovibrio norvegicus TaxID=188144 RepID=UPI000304C60C|nr:tetratricopeptide repeat protein [Enterovibrio norvegicus]OEE65032.1 hypothetical protein A1OS_15490 [Enterovibrio norvegicus]
MSIERMQQYLALDPGNSLLACDVVEALAKMGDFEGAKEALNTALTHNNKDAHLLSWKGHISLALKDYDEAISAYGDLFSEGYDQSGLKINCALAHFQKKAFAEANELLDDIEGLDVKNGLMKARCLAHMEHIPEAITLTRDLLTQCDSTEEADVLGALSLFYVDDALYEEADKYQALALGINAEQTDALVTAASLALYKLDMDTAEQKVSRLMSMMPTSGRVLAMKALIHMYRQELVEAISTYELACKEMPDHVGSRVNLAWCFFATGDLDTAEKTFNEAVEIEHNFAECHGGLAVVKAYREEWNASKQLAKKALKLDAQCASALFARSLYLKVKGMDEQAEMIMSGVMSFKSELAEQNLSDTITLNFLTKKKLNG